LGPRAFYCKQTRLNSLQRSELRTLAGSHSELILKLYLSDDCRIFLDRHLTIARLYLYCKTLCKTEQGRLCYNWDSSPDPSLRFHDNTTLRPNKRVMARPASRRVHVSPLPRTRDSLSSCTIAVRASGSTYPQPHCGWGQSRTTQATHCASTVTCASPLELR
jgi:hypothetical protein